LTSLFRFFLLFACRSPFFSTISVSVFLVTFVRFDRFHSFLFPPPLSSFFFLESLRSPWPSEITKLPPYLFPLPPLGQPDAESSSSKHLQQLRPRCRISFPFFLSKQSLIPPHRPGLGRFLCCPRNHSSSHTSPSPRQKTDLLTS